MRSGEVNKTTLSNLPVWQDPTKEGSNVEYPPRSPVCKIWQAGQEKAQINIYYNTDVYFLSRSAIKSCSFAPQVKKVSNFHSLMIQKRYNQIPACM